MMRTTILITALLVSMLSASAVYAQRVESALYDGLYPVINCDKMPSSMYTTVAKGNAEATLKTAAANERVYKRFAVHNKDNSTASNWSAAFTVCSNLGTDWRLPTQRELMLIWVLKRELERTSGFTWFTTSNYYRSATEYGSKYSWFVDFRQGYMYNNSTNDFGFRVRCVRELTP